MSRLHLIVDGTNLANRCFYGYPSLTIAGKPAGAIIGFLRAVLSLRQQYGAACTVFCFDKGEPLRRRILPAYQTSRQNRPAPEDPTKDRRFLERQIYELRAKILTRIGFTVLAAEGYEADDLIACVVNHWNVKRSVIVSSDKDLYQLLYDRRARQITQHNLDLKREVTAGWFENTYGIRPDWWHRVKAISGCDSDDIPGVPGVGEKTAVKYLNGLLGTHTQAYASIESQKDMIRRNETLTALPLAGTKFQEIHEDQDDPQSWREALEPYNATRLLQEYA